MDIYGVTLKILAVGKVTGLMTGQLTEQIRPIQMLSRLRALFLPGRAGAGAGLENLVQVAEFGSYRQL